MLVLGFDVETTGLDTANDHITQLGAVLWDTKAAIGRKRAKLTLNTSIIHVQMPNPLDPKITEITGMVYEDLEAYGMPPAIVFNQLLWFLERAEAVVAHNGNLFDKPMLKSNMERHGYELPEKLWIDTSCDIEYPAEIATRKLSYLATEHGFLNPFPHDAVSDVLTMLKIADRYDWAKTVEWAKSPTLVVQAVSTFHQKELVKKQNYRWNNENKIWTKSIKEFQLADAQQAAKEAGFSVAVLKGAV